MKSYILQFAQCIMLFAAATVYAESPTGLAAATDLRPLMEQLEQEYNAGDPARRVRCIGPVTSFELVGLPKGAIVRYDGRDYVIPADGRIEFVTIRGVDTFSVIRDGTEVRHVIRALRRLRMQRRWAWGREPLMSTAGAMHREYALNGFGTLLIRVGESPERQG